jgi:hypothetical protein
VSFRLCRRPVSGPFSLDATRILIAQRNTGRTRDRCLDATRLEASAWVFTLEYRLAKSHSWRSTQNTLKSRGFRITALQHASGAWHFLRREIFGSGQQKAKVCLVLSKEPFEYQTYISDFAGQDIPAHANEPYLAVKSVRSFLSTHLRQSLLSPKVLWDRCMRFSKELRLVCAEKELDEDELQFGKELIYRPNGPKRIRTKLIRRAISYFALDIELPLSTGALILRLRRESTKPYS